MAVLLLKQNWNCWTHSQYIYSNLCTEHNRLTSNSRLQHLLHSNVLRLLKGKGRWIQKRWSQQLILVFLINLHVSWKQGLVAPTGPERARRASPAHDRRGQAGVGRAWAPDDAALSSTGWQLLNLCSHLNWPIVEWHTSERLTGENEDESLTCPGSKEA